MFTGRIAALQAKLGKELQGIIITNLKNIRYLCGFSGSCGTLLVTRKSAYFFTDFRYQQQSAKEVCDAVEIVIFKNNLIDSLLKQVKKSKLKTLAVEKSISVNLYMFFNEKFGMDLLPVAGMVEDLRRCKSDDEIKSLKKAFSIADNAFAELIKIIKPGMTESQIAAHLEFFMKSSGSTEPSFSTIIASGPNSACPHASPGNRKIKKGEMLKIDFGAVYDGYHSDMTRTVFIGKATEKFKKVYDVVLTAQKEAIKALRVGAICKDIDAVARKVIADAGYGEYFGHGLGHSLGLDVHEAPSLSSKCEDKIVAGVTFTVEPGIYLPDWGGIRIEDVFLVKEKGLLKFTGSPNSIIEIKC